MDFSVIKKALFGRVDPNPSDPLLGKGISKKALPGEGAMKDFRAGYGFLKGLGALAGSLFRPLGLWNTQLNSGSVGLSHDSIYFSDARVGSSRNGQFSIYNNGVKPITVSLSAPYGFSVPYKVYVPGEGSARVNVSFSPPAAGDFSGHIEVSHTSQSVWVRGRGISNRP